MTAHGCGALDDVIAELAVGLLDGAERAEALEHIERCGDCQAEVASLTAVGEQLLLLAPEVPPPAGFESRVLGRIAPASGGLSPLGSPGAGRAPWWRRGPLLVAAAAAVVLVLALAAALSPWTGSDQPGGDQVAATDMISTRGRVVGQAVLWDRSPPVMEVDVREWIDGMVEHGARLEDRWWLSVDNDDGSRDMYAITLSEDDSSRVTLRGGPEEIVAVALVDDEGDTWCSARFPT